MKDTLESLAELSQRIRSLHRGTDKLVWPREFKRKVIQLHDQQGFGSSNIQSLLDLL